jgi:Prokaryotic metallothionein
MAEPSTCAFDPCECALASEQTVRRDGAEYCSERCADGRGCDHAGCNCGDFPEEEPSI